MTPNLEDVLSGWRERASSARILHEPDKAQLIDDICDQVARAAEPFMRFISERDAQLRSSKGLHYFKTRFREWEAQGNARVGAKGRREYRLCVVPVRANTDGARARGRRGEHAA